MKPYYCQGGITIYCGDSREFVPSAQPGLVLTDPPYGINYRSNHNSSRRGKWARWIRTENLPGIRGDDSPLDPALILGLCCPAAIFGANYCADRLPPSRCWIVWNKRDGIGQNNQADCELAWTNFNRPSRIFNHLWSGLLRAGEENVALQDKQHPHQKPVALLRYIINYSQSDGFVYDPYMGSGSTLLAAKLEGREAVGVEIEERYCEVAANRLAQGVFSFGGPS